LVALLLALAGVAVWRWMSGPRVRIVPAQQPSAAAVEPAFQVLEVSAAVDGLAWNAAGDQLAVQTVDPDSHARSLVLWDLKAARQTGVPYESPDPLVAIGSSADGEFLACGVWRRGHNRQADVLLWNWSSGQRVASLAAAPRAGLGFRVTSDPLCLAFSPDARWLVVGTKLVDDEYFLGRHIGGEVCLWDLPTRTLKWSKLSIHTDTVEAAAFSPDAQLLATAGRDKLIRLWEPETGEVVGTLVGAGWGGIVSLGFSPDGSLLASGGSGEEEGGQVRLWDVRSRTLRHILTPRFNGGTAARVAFSQDGRTLFAVGSAGDRNAPTWRLAAWKVPPAGSAALLGGSMLLERPGSARTIVRSPDGRWLAIGSFEGEVVLFPIQARATDAMP
jgi:WD40 repeat protein